MAVNNRIAEFHDEMKGWRRDIHAHPETAFEELRTADFVAEKLAEFGIEVHRGLATTGVVGVLDGQSNRSGRSIGLRRSEEHTSGLQSLMRLSYAVFCLDKKNKHKCAIT